RAASGMSEGPSPRTVVFNLPEPRNSGLNMLNHTHRKVSTARHGAQPTYYKSAMTGAKAIRPAQLRRLSGLPLRLVHETIVRVMNADIIFKATREYFIEII